MKSLKLWKLKSEGSYEYVRNVEPDEANEWLAILKRTEPSQTYVVSRNRPTTKRVPKKRVKASLVGRTAFVVRFIPGHPIGIPTDAAVEIVETRGERVAVSYRNHTYWTDTDNLRIP